MPLHVSKEKQVRKGQPTSSLPRPLAPADPPLGISALGPLSSSCPLLAFRIAHSIPCIIEHSVQRSAGRPRVVQDQGKTTKSSKLFISSLVLRLDDFLTVDVRGVVCLFSEAGWREWKRFWTWEDLDDGISWQWFPLRSAGAWRNADVTSEF
ncbi:hypothetical protein K402DRAFT_399207 [Aulographum hederae CBS 113979]|uniref:Uncharacterized protein n=1 Tax=Aulographum hederae CBS 113979 TaxID=1176131 RepID=A0A6G1GIB8_9PEZI|nr:hypothetical protein K402DRAFT_399207 [Aulographum hederae CBS 113979]